MKINEVEQLVGITKKNIRFYEHEGLLNPMRSENGYRNYSQEDVTELKKIKLLRSLSFPLEEIRKLQSGALTIEDAARRHEIFLEREKSHIEKSQRLCAELQELRQPLQDLTPDIYLQEMQEMEKEGTVFMDIKKKDRRKDYMAPVLAASVIILFISAFIILLISEVLTQALSPGEALFLSIVVLSLAAVIVGVLLALKQRFKQIEGGEEDAAAKY